MEGFQKYGSNQAPRSGRHRFATGYARRRSFGERQKEALLSAWFGEEFSGLEIEAGQKRAQRLGTIIDGVLADLDRHDHYLLRKIIDQWGEIVGPQIRHYASPRRLDRGILYVEVSSSAWRFKLEREFRPEIEKLVQRFTDQRVKSIRFIATGRTRR